jgi:hypothetical protein
VSAPSTALRAGRDPYHIGHAPSAGVPEYTGHGAGGPAPKRIVVGYGFWIFILSDVILFSCFFATYTVLIYARNGGPVRATSSTCIRLRSRPRACSYRASHAD